MAAPRGKQGVVVDVDTGVLRRNRVLVQRTPAAVVVMGLGPRADGLRRFACAETGADGNPFIARCRGFAQAIERGQLAKSLQRTVPRSILKMNDRTLRRLAIAEALAKAGYDPQELRDERGRWTSTGKPSANDSTGSAEPAREKESPGPGDVKENPGSPGRSSSPPVGSPSLAFVAPSAAGTDFAASLAGREAWTLGGDLAPGLFAGLAEIAARVSVATIVFRTLFIPSNSDLKWRGAVTDRPDITYEYDRDTGWLKLARDGQTFYVGQNNHGLFYDDGGRVLARFVEGHIVFDADALPAVAANVGAGGRSQGPSGAVDDEPKLCPAPQFEPSSKGVSNASGGYQMQITGLPWGFGVELNGVMFDGCREADGTMLEAKAFYLQFVRRSNPVIWRSIIEPGIVEQAKRQSEAAKAAGRQLEWYFAEEELAVHFRRRFERAGLTNIKVFYQPYIRGKYKPE